MVPAPIPPSFRRLDGALHQLILNFPMPLALVDLDSGEVLANVRFLSMLNPAEITRSPLREVVISPGFHWQRLRVPGLGGFPVEVAARSLHTDAGALLLLDDSPARAEPDELAALRLRVAELESVSVRDRLTGAWNRLHFDSMIASEIARSAQYGQSLTLLLVDIDHFKRVNDELGHANGDRVLCELVTVLKQTVRDADLVFRWGGEEFAVLAVGTNSRTASTLAEKIRRAVEDRSFQYAGALTVSIGGAEYAEHEEAAAWFERADRQLYLAKSGGRNRACVAPPPVPTGGAPQSWPPLRLQWHEAYESGAAELDTQHRAIFARANNLLAAMCGAEPDRDVVARAMDALVESVATHFRYEEALLELHGYEKVREHAAAHRRLLSQAAELKAAMDRGQASVGPVVSYLANEVVSGHLAREDREFFPLLVRAGVRAA